MSKRDQLPREKTNNQGTTYLQVRSKSKLLANPNEPLGGVVLVPSDRIPVVHWKLVVEVVVALPNGNKCSNQVVTRSVFIIKRRLAQPVSKRVDTKRRL